MCSLSITVLDGVAGLLAKRSAWDDCVARTGGDIYFTADWIAVWWEHFSANRRLLPLCLWRGPDLAGVLAVCIETFWLGPLPVRMGRLAGMDPNYPILGLPLPCGHEDEALQLVFREVLTAQKCTGFSLSPISDLAVAVAPIRQAAGALGLRMGADTGGRQHTVIALPARFEEYWAGLSKGRQKEHTRSQTKIAKVRQTAHFTSSTENAVERFDAFASLHTAQWNAIGKGGHLADWPSSGLFYRDMVARLAQTGRAVIEEHRGDDKAMSSRLTFLYNGRAYWRLTARSLDPEIAPLGVGRVGLVERIDRLIKTGVTMIEAAAGDYDYKLHYGGSTAPMRRMIIGRPQPLRRLQLLLLLTWAELLDVAYYRIWFLKLAPRQRHLNGAEPQPLWHIWIRTRL